MKPRLWEGCSHWFLSIRQNRRGRVQDKTPGKGQFKELRSQKIGRIIILCIKIAKN